MNYDCKKYNVQNIHMGFCWEKIKRFIQYEGSILVLSRHSKTPVLTRRMKRTEFVSFCD